MKYWLYSEGNISGPYSVEELAALPSFSPDSLVCPEGVTGTNPNDWKNACEISEIAELVKVGVLQDNTLAFNQEQSIDGAFFNLEQQGSEYSYSNLLNTIDNILNTYKSEKEEKKEIFVENKDFDVIDKFDIRIAKIQEELEAARWEKNVLLERLRLKEEEEKKDKQRIEELEKKLSDILKKLESEEKVVYIEKDKEEKEKKEISEKIEKIRQINEMVIEKEEKPLEGEKTEVKIEEKKKDKEITDIQGSKKIELKKLSSLKKISDIASEKIIDERQEEKKENKEDFTIKTGQLKSFGYITPKRIFEEDKEEGIKESKEIQEEKLKPLPQQETSVVYDFTAVTPKIEVKDVEKVSFKIEPKSQSLKEDIPSQVIAPFSQREEIKKEKSTSLSPQSEERFAMPPQQKMEIPGGKPKEAPEEVKAPEFIVNRNFEIPQSHVSVEAKNVSSLSPLEKTEIASQKADVKPIPAQETEKKEVEKDTDKTVRVLVAPLKKEEAKKEEVKKGVKSKSHTRFVLTLLMFGIIAIGGLFYFFSGEREVKDISLIAVRGGKTSLKSEEAVMPAPQTGTSTQPPQITQQHPSSIRTSENVKKSIEIVKNYNLSDGRGTINSWFTNNFANSKQVSDEWSSTLLQENTYVVQYRVIRAKQEPVVYQFEVDVEKGVINRGINNNAIELLEPLKKEVVTQPSKSKKKPLKVAKLNKKNKKISLLPLPEKEETDILDEPTGLENADTIVTGKVKINAPESDEELF